MGVAATRRLYYDDSYLTRFRARVVARNEGGRRLYLDETAFYPASGGQPQDRGQIAGVAVVDVIDEGDRIAHLTAAPVEGDEVSCVIDWDRRFDHMQQHTGQHVLSAVFVELFQAQTVGFHLGAETSTIDLSVASLETSQIAAAERRANEIVCENRVVTVSYQLSTERLDLRRPSEREGLLRIVSIDGLDRSACGGTHVRATGEVGAILIRKLEKAHGRARVEFVCGLRAIQRARADFEALSRIALRLSAAPEETPRLVADQAEALQAAERAQRKLALELARYRGRELYHATPPDSEGLRRVVKRIAAGAIGDELRALAQSFTSGSQAVFLAVSENPPSLLLAASGDSGIHAGELLRSVLSRLGGRGGGNAQLAQGSAPSREALERAVAELAAG